MIYFGDNKTLLSTLPNDTVDLVVTDPPYGMSYRTNHRKDKTHRFNQVIENDADLSSFISIVPDLYRVMKQNTAIYVFCGSDPKLEQEVTNALDKFFTVKNSIIWVKNNWTAGDLKAQFGKQHERIIYANKGRCHIRGRRDSDVWFEDRVVGKQQIHQNQKPVKLLEKIIEKSSDEGALVLDPFIGSGSTYIAARNKNRFCLGAELDRYYYQAALHRMGIELHGDTKTITGR